MAGKGLGPYARIITAARLGRGVRLTADEAFALSHDDAIQMVAVQEFDDAGLDWELPYVHVPPTRQKGSDESDD